MLKLGKASIETKADPTQGKHYDFTVQPSCANADFTSPNCLGPDTVKQQDCLNSDPSCG